MYFFKSGSFCNSGSLSYAAAIAGKSHRSTIIVRVRLDKQSAIMFWSPFMWPISDIYSVRIANCCCCLSDLDYGMCCTKAYGQLTIKLVFLWQYNRAKYAAKSSLLKVEYLVWVWVNFLEKSIGIGAPSTIWCKVVPIA